MKFFFHISRRINRWLGSRRWKIFVFCLPSLLAVIGMLMVGVVVVRQNPVAFQRKNDFLTRYFLESRDYEHARVAALRGLAGATTDNERAQWIFYLALAMNGQNHYQDAMSLLLCAAPLTPAGTGCVEAHLMVAQNLLTDTNITTEALSQSKLHPTNAVAQTLHAAERHLLSALAIDPQSLEANELLARFYINTKNPLRAQELLMKIFAAKPDTALLLAITADMQNDGTSVLQWSGRALVALENNLVQSAPRYNPTDREGLVRALALQHKYAAPSDATKPLIVITNAVPQDSPQIWLGIVKLLLINGKYGEALTTLERQMQASPNPAYRSAIAQVCTILAQSIPPPPKGDAITRLRFIKEGLTNSPNNLQLEFLLVQATYAPDQTALEAKALQDELMAAVSGTAAAAWHFSMARDASVRGDLAAKRRELETASKLAPDVLLIKNNLAMLDLDSTNRSDWEKGLQLAESAVAFDPHDSAFRSTRGEIFAKLGRNQEAIEDLEFAIPRLVDASKDKEILAKIYAGMGVVHRESASDRLIKVRNLIGEGNYPQAFQNLEQSMLIDTNPIYATALADACAGLVDNLPASKHAERLKLVQDGLKLDPRHQKLRTLLLEITRIKDDTGLAATKFLNDLVANASGESAVEWHLFLGRNARTSGDMVAARQHLEAAQKLDPLQTQIQIELARVLSVGTATDIQRGLELIQPVVDKFPDNAEFKNIRGQILARLGRNREAVDDLTYAIPRLSDSKDSMAARRILAGVYDAMGKPQLAEQQRHLLGGSGGQY